MGSYLLEGRAIGGYGQTTLDPGEALRGAPLPLRGFDRRIGHARKRSGEFV
jgi:hypothetical protein